MEIKSLGEMTDSEKIKFYINAAKEAEEETKITSSNRTVKIHYEITLSSGLDAIIERVDRKNVKSLIIMPSQNTYVFKQEDAVQDINLTNWEDFSLFFNQIPESGISVNNVIIDTIKKEYVRALYEMIKTKQNELREGLLSLNLYVSELYKYLENDKKIWKLVTTKSPILRNVDKYDKGFIDMASGLYESRGYDAAFYFVESYTKSSMRSINVYGYYGGYNRYIGINESIVQIIKIKDLDTKRFIDYICFDLYAQGFEQIPITTYYDYLRMSMEYENRIRDKYPNALLTAHDVMALKYDLNKIEIDKKIFAGKLNEITTKLSNLDTDFTKDMDLKNSVLFKYKGKTLFLPKQSTELIEEGQNLGHCVGSYVRRMIEGECFVGFVRENSNIERSYLTVEFRPINEYGKDNYSISQIQGDLKRTALSENEKEFFKKLLEKSGFKTTNRNL